MIVQFCSLIHSNLLRYAWLHPAILFVPFGNKNRFNSGQKSTKGTVVEDGLFNVSRWLYSAYCRVNKWVLNVTSIHISIGTIMFFIVWVIQIMGY